MREDVRIIYCNDEIGNPIHYSKTVRGDKYFCIDCGSELICKDGDIKVKHLAHKNTDNCGGTGESIFHKHWKENLFKAGMFIDISNKLQEPRNVEIIDVINEVSLSSRYGKEWDRDVIVDVLLVTDVGDIVVEINYKNPKKWNELKPYYDELDLLRVFEVKVGKSINAQLEWSYLGEDEDTMRIQKEIKEEKKKLALRNKHIEEEKKRVREEKRIEKKQQKQKEENMRWESIQRGVADGVYTDAQIFMNFKTPLKSIAEGIYTIECLYQVEGSKIYKPVRLKFDIGELKITKKKIEREFDIKKGIKYSFIVFDNQLTGDGYYNVLDFVETHNNFYNNILYAKLCNIR